MSEEFEATGARPVTDEPETDIDDVAAAPVTMGEPAVDPERTGNHAVDRVLDSLDELPDKPIEEHVTVFERAHEQLRGALDGPRLPKP